MSDISINLIKKRIESSGNITPKVARIFAENIGTLLKEYKSEINIDQLMRQALKKENHPKPSELLSRYRVYSDKVYNEKTFERLAKDPKKYLSIVTCLAELLSLDEDYFIRSLVSKTRFSKVDLSEEDENYDFGPINRINDIIRSYSFSIIDRYNLKDFHQSNLAKEIFLRWNEELRKNESDVNENLYEVLEQYEVDIQLLDFISIVPLIETFKKVSLCKFSYSNENIIHNRFLIEGNRISLGLFYDDHIKKRILPKIKIEPFLYLPGISLKKEILPPIYLLKESAFPKKYMSNINGLSFNQDFIKNVDKNIFCHSIYFKEVNTYNPYGKFENYIDFIIQYSPYHIAPHYTEAAPYPYVANEGDWVKDFLISENNNDLINIIDLEDDLWIKILKSSFNNKIGRPGLAFCYNFPMNIETKVVSSERLDTYRGRFYTEVLSNILNESIGIKKQDTKDFQYYLKHAQNEFLELSQYDNTSDNKSLEGNFLDLMKEFNIEELCFSENYLDIDFSGGPYFSKNKFPTYFKEFDTGVFDFMDVLERDVKRRVEAINIITKKERDYIEKKFEKKIAYIKSLGKN